MLTYAGASALHASGFAAVYVAALVLGNSELPHRGATRSFIEGLGWLSQIGLFVMLGLLLSPARIDTTQILQALVAGFLLTVVARPLSVWASTIWERTSWPDMAFMSWAGLRGAVPIVLATIPLSEGVEGAERALPDRLRPGRHRHPGHGSDPSLGRQAPRRHGRRDGARHRDRGGSSGTDGRGPAGDPDHQALEDVRASRSASCGCPQGASVSLIVRDGEIKVPDARTVLRKGDDVLVVTPRKQRVATEDRLRAVSQRGRLAHWLD